MSLSASPEQHDSQLNELHRVAGQQGVALVGHFASLGDLFELIRSIG